MQLQQQGLLLAPREGWLPRQPRASAEHKSLLHVGLCLRCSSHGLLFLISAFKKKKWKIQTRPIWLDTGPKHATYEPVVIKASVTSFCDVLATTMLKASVHQAGCRNGVPPRLRWVLGKSFPRQGNEGNHTCTTGCKSSDTCTSLEIAFSHLWKSPAFILAPREEHPMCWCRRNGRREPALKLPPSWAAAIPTARLMISPPRKKNDCTVQTLLNWAA